MRVRLAFALLLTVLAAGATAMPAAATTAVLVVSPSHGTWSQTMAPISATYTIDACVKNSIAMLSEDLVGAPLTTIVDPPCNTPTSMRLSFTATPRTLVGAHAIIASLWTNPLGINPINGSVVSVSYTVEPAPQAPPRAAPTGTAAPVKQVPPKAPAVSVGEVPQGPARLCWGWCWF